MYGAPVHEIKARLSSQEVTELQAAYRAGLLPDPWQQTALVACLLANCHRGKDQPPYKMEDFFLRSRPQQMTQEEWDQHASHR